MRPDPRKIWVVATTEFGSAIRTKAFIFTLLMFPILYGLSIGMEVRVAKGVDTRTRTLAVVDRTGALYPAIERAAEAHNKAAVDPQGRMIAPRLEPSRADAGDGAELELSDRIRRSQLDA